VHRRDLPAAGVACLAGADEVRSDLRAIERAWNDVIPGHLAGNEGPAPKAGGIGDVRRIHVASL
jgi:hypothetical protein